MPLPFLKDNERKTGGVGQEFRKADGSKGNPEQPSGLMECARLLIDGVKADDEDKVAEAFQAAFDILDSAPHEEYDHDQDDSYTDDQE